MPKHHPAMPRSTIPFLRDPRHFQLLFLGGFLLYGILALQWDVRLGDYAVLLGTALGVQYLFIRRYGLDLRSLKSAGITGLGLSILLHAGHPLTLAFAAAVAIASKFLLRIDGKHVFNPGMLGIVAAVALTGDAWISPGQWGSGVALVFLVGAAGLMVLLRCGRIDTTLAFLGTFAALDLLRTVLYLGWGLDVWGHRLMNGSLLLFACFMITDPMTTPKALRARVLWAMMIATIAFVMGSWAYVNTAPIWALFALSAATPVLDRAFGGERFRWLGVERLNAKG